MNSFYKKRVKQLTAIFTIVSMLMANLAFAAQPALSTIPLGALAGSVKPNLMYVLDTSGSMEKSLPNDTLDSAGQCKSANKNKPSLASVSKLIVGNTPYKTLPTTRLSIFPSWNTGKSVGDNVYLTVPGKPNLSGYYKIKAVNIDSTSSTPVYVPTPATPNPVVVGAPAIAAKLPVSTKKEITAVYRAPSVDVAAFSPVINQPTAVNASTYVGQVINPVKLYESNYVAPSGDTGATYGCKITSAMPANGGLAADHIAGYGFSVKSYGVSTETNTACYWWDVKDKTGCKLGPAPANAAGATGTVTTPGFLQNPDGTVTTTTDNRCYYQDLVDTKGCALPAVPANNAAATTTQYTYGTVINVDGSSTSTQGACRYKDLADTIGCRVPATCLATDANAATCGLQVTPATPSNINSSIPDARCGWTTSAAVTGCQLPAKPAMVTTGVGAAGIKTYGVQVTPGTPNVVTTTPDSRCYWFQPADTPAGSVIDHYDVTVTGKYSLEVDIAAETAATYDIADTNTTLSDVVKDAWLVNLNEDNNCSDAEPPKHSAQINSLAYDPTVSYQPPPSPIKVGQGKPEPTNMQLSNLNAYSSVHNLLPSMDKTYTVNWTKVRADGTKLDASSAQNSAFYNLTQMPEMVFCDTPTIPSKPSSFTGTWDEKAWLNSSHCQRNDTTPNNAIGVSSWPYKVPAITAGTAYTDWLSNYKNEHQNGVIKGTKNPIFDFQGNEYYAFGKTDNNAVPYYYKVTPIEYCKKADLKECSLQNVKDSTYKFPSYVRYCTTSAQAIDTTNAQSNNCQASYTGTTFRYARYGLFEKTELIAGHNYPKSPGDNGRTDCSGLVGPTGCSYDEEMTNMANWYSYYRTRMQLMKTASARAFNTIDDSKMRVGLMTIYADPNNYLPIQDFNSGTTSQKRSWYELLYKQAPSLDTPLRAALGTVGRIYAGQNPLGLSTTDDPIQYSCQKNYTLLTTDGYWNGDETFQIDGATLIGNQDDSASVLRPYHEAPLHPPTASEPWNVPAAPNTLADVAQYYYETDLRDSTLNNCKVPSVCINDVVDDKATQHMTTYTLGLGVDGNLNYSSTYKEDVSGDYQEIVAGSKQWPVPEADITGSSYTGVLATVDDLWHAAVNGRGLYIGAKNPVDVKNGINKMLTSIGTNKGAASAAAVSNQLPVAGDNYAYSSNFITGDWVGNLYARTVDSDGNLSANALWCAENEDGVNPICTGTMASKIAVGSDTRTIYINNGGILKSFKYANLNTTQQGYFDSSEFSNLSQWAGFSTTQQGLVTGNHLVDYLRGQRDYEDITANSLDNKLFRARSKTLGDVIDSPPTFVGKASLQYGDLGYSAFVTSTVSGVATGPTGANRSTTGRTLYVGANDGMLHAFDANDGTERWAFVPNTVLPNMWKLADKAYQHANYVNGPIEVTDICTANCGAATSTWKTILVSGLGQGGQGYFALDVTDPAKPSFLWEVNSSNLGNMGYSYGKPVITKMADGTWVTLLTSGYNNTGDGKGYLYVLNAYTGATIKTLTTGVGDTTTPSGLAQISSYASDPTADFTSLFVYGGDLLGNLWRFDINTSANAQLLTTFKNSSGALQPITVAPTLVSIEGKRVVVVGTGKYLESSDLVVTGYPQQSIYAFKDDDITTTISNAALRSNMVGQVLTTDLVAGTRSITNNQVDWSTKRGWYIDLSEGERQNIKATLVSGNLYVATLVPSTGSCDTNGRGWLNVFNVESGSSVINNGVAVANVSYLTSAPLAGFTLLGKVNTDGSVDVTTLKTCLTGDCTTTDPKLTIGAPGGFKNTRAVWRELVE